jgi:protoheme IX farnesyltransferase
LNARALSVSATASDFLSLTKPRLSSLVLVTTAGGMWLSPNGLSPARQIASLLAVAGLVGGANALNCFIERDVDRLMARTRNRPLPAGRMDPQVALWFGALLAAVSAPTLFFEANAITALLGCLAFLTYVFVYTPLKSRSYAAMLVGAVPGALPPLMGWTAANGRIGGPGLVLFAILFLWQLPHFIAIALYRRDEYAAAGLKSLPVQRGEQASRLQLLGYTAALVPVTLLPSLLGIAGLFYGVLALMLGAIALGMALRGALSRLGRQWARQVFRFSLFHLAMLFAGLWIDVGLRR